LIANFQAAMNDGGHIDSIEILEAQIICNLTTLLRKYHATNSVAEANGRNLPVLKK
jgi:hypothetical protein